MTGPHGRGSSTCSAPNCTKLLEAWELHTNCACRVKSRENSSLVHRETGLYGKGRGAHRSKLLAHQLLWLQVANPCSALDTCSLVAR